MKLAFAGRLAIWLLILSSRLAMLVSCQYYSRTEKSAPTSNPGVFATQEPMHWATIAPMTTHTPTPTIQPLRIFPKGRIAFQSERDGNLEIYLVNADGTFLSRLTNNPAVDVFPAWSPAGDQLLFTSDRNGNPDIYRVNADGTGLRSDSPITRLRMPCRPGRRMANGLRSLQIATEMMKSM